MIRVAIIDHAGHRLYVEDINENELNESYNGSEEEYIKCNYYFDGEFSWDYITDAEYIPDDLDGTPIDIDFGEIADIFG